MEKMSGTGAMSRSNTLINECLSKTSCSCANQRA